MNQALIQEQELEDTLNNMYDHHVKDIKSGLYGKFIKVNDDGTYQVDDGVLLKDLKIENNKVYWIEHRVKDWSKWRESIPIIPIEKLRHEQDFFENRTQMLNTDQIFQYPDYYYSAKRRIATIEYMSPMEYMEKIVKGFGNITLKEQIDELYKPNIEKYSEDILKGDKFPLMSIEYYKDGSIDQEGRHRAMALQTLINEGKIPKDTKIPVVVVHQV